MKKIFLTMLLLAGFVQVMPVQATTGAKNENPVGMGKMPAQQSEFSSSFANMTTDEFLELTPKKVKAATGKKMKLKEVIALKAAQKAVKKQMKSADKAGSGIDKTVYIILAIFIPFLAVGLATDWQGNDWWICLLLTFLFWIPGVIFAFVKMGDYY